MVFYKNKIRFSCVFDGSMVVGVDGQAKLYKKECDVTLFSKKKIEKKIQFDDVIKKVWLIRHGQSTANAGAATDNHITIPLSADGHEQAKQVSLSFPETPTLIITSPFLRTQQTAEPTMKRFPNVSCEVWDVEEFTYLSPETCIGTTAAERKERVNEYWERLDPDYIDGEGAESFTMFLSRAQITIERLSQMKSGFIVMFTHAQFMRAMWVLNNANGEEAKSLMKCFRELPRFENCEIMRWE